jgi:hypothetical protein
VGSTEVYKFTAPPFFAAAINDASAGETAPNDTVTDGDGDDVDPPAPAEHPTTPNTTATNGTTTPTRHTRRTPITTSSLQLVAYDCIQWIQLVKRASICADFTAD